MHLSCPGKSFLAGEYLALKGGPALVFASKPRFAMLSRFPQGSRLGANLLMGIHPESPAGKYIKDHSEVFEKHSFDFQDPHHGKGGWGASTAQFLMAYALVKGSTDFSVSELLENYWKYAWNGEGQRPSGADLVGQLKGSLCYFDRQENGVETYQWPFTNLDFSLIPTGHKLATHEHLKTLKDFDTEEFAEAMSLIRKALARKNEDDMITGIQRFGAALDAQDLVAEHTQTLLEEISQVPGVVAAKGCGALGADVVLVLHRPNISLKHSVLARSADLSTGLELCP